MTRAGPPAAKKKPTRSETHGRIHHMHEFCLVPSIANEFFDYTEINLY